MTWGVPEYSKVQHLNDFGVRVSKGLVTFAGNLSLVTLGSAACALRIVRDPSHEYGGRLGLAFGPYPAPAPAPSNSS
jgi:hypothetical protein